MFMNPMKAYYAALEASQDRYLAQLDKDRQRVLAELERHPKAPPLPIARQVKPAAGWSDCGPMPKAECPLCAARNRLTGAA